MHKIRLVAVILVVIAAIALAAHFSTTDLEYSRYNWEWTGTSGFFSLLEEQGARDITAYAALSGSNDTLLLIIAPDAPYTPDEVSALRSFLDGGNTVFIADETGESNELLAGLGSTISVIYGNLSSADREYADPRSVMVYPKGEDPITANVSALVLNRPAVVSGGDILLTTSLFSWVDANGNGRIDGGEDLSSFAVLAREAVGNGTLYVFSDPSIVANGMLNARLTADNRLFIDQLLTIREHVLVDQSHSLTAGADAVLSLANRVKNTMVIKISLLILSITTLAFACSRRWGDDHGPKNH
jgi:hypothetical protein